MAMICTTKNNFLRPKLDPRSFKLPFMNHFVIARPLFNIQIEIKRKAVLNNVDYHIFVRIPIQALL